MSNFSFGAPSTSGQSTGSLFGTAGANNTASGGSTLFGGASTGTGWSFGQSTTAAASSTPATADSRSGGLFGQTSTPASSQTIPGSLFGQSSNKTGIENKPAGGLFGAPAGANIFGAPKTTQPADTSRPLFGSTNSSSQIPGTPNQPQTTKSFFGSTTPAPAPAPAPAAVAPAATTGAPTGPSIFGNASTTPAGQPPSQSLFGASTGTATLQPQSSSTPTFSFGQKPSDSSSTAPASGGLFGAKPAATQSTASSSIFGAPKPAAPSTSGSLFSAPAPSAGPAFSFAPKKDDKPNEPTPKSDAPKPFSFPSAAASGTTITSQPATSGLFTQPTAPSQPATTQSSSSAGNLFAKPAAPASQNPEQSKPAGFSFQNLGAPQSSTVTAQPNATANPAPKSIFQSSTGATSQSTTTTAALAPASAAAAAPASSTTAGPFSLGGKISFPTSQTNATTSTIAPAAPAVAPPVTAPSTLGPSTLGASTAGPAPPAQSRLRNKTMDEILTRWASDLTRYTKEFKSHAETIAHWDQIIVDTSTKIDKLYVKTRTCEKQTMSVEMQLSAVENQQNELEAWLNKYENDVDEMLAKDGPAPNELGGPDQERERTYKLAERLGERLDGMGRDLQSMIEEVNAANTGLGQGSKTDEPITQIVKILNSHLSQLQAIDQGTTALQAKVTAAQKTASGLNYLTGSTNGDNQAAVNDFYRSYMGRR